MKSTVAKSLTAVALAALLSGCQSFPVIGGLFGSRGHPETARPAPELAGAQMLEEGRAQLAAGEISAAVASFRLAAMDSSTQADAFNGLGVAYARLGRADLADRYFTTAIELRPDDMRFAGNLMRLRHQVMLARRSRIEQEQALASPAPSSPALAASARHQDVAVADGPAQRPAVLHIATRADLGEPAHVAVVGAAPAVATAPRDQADAAAGGEIAATPGPLTVEIALNN